MIEENSGDAKQNAVETQDLDATGKFFKKEKRVDYQNTQVKMKEGQEKVGKRSTSKVYNPSNNIVEIDLGRDKSVRIPPYTVIELDSEELKTPGFETIKNLVKIY